MATYPRDMASSAGRVDQYPFTVFRRAFSTNVTATGVIAFSVPTGTPPTTVTDGVHELEHGKQIIVYPYGTDADNEEFRLAVQLWFPLYDRVPAKRAATAGENIAWIPVTAAILDCNMNSAMVPAAASGPLATTDMFCDTVILAAGTTQNLVTAGMDMIASGGEIPTKTSATATINTIGAKYVQFLASIDGQELSADSTSCNALFAVI